MPRRGRARSTTDIYHVMLRGINQQNIFEDDEDCHKMIQILIDVKEKSKFELYSYCLMGNHCHLLLKTLDEDIALIFKRICVRYVYWYNLKYKRIGHLFQDRFRSEVVENDRNFLSVLNYIHQNPVKAGMCVLLSDYKWSSYNEYMVKPRVIDTEFVFSLINKKELEKFHNIENTENVDKLMEYKAPIYRLSDAESKELIKKI
ncbi:MAG: transposase [Oscillospiraceae bacterium]|jgi:REP element-mobilizing transposase RayT|nr:transposase [Oscillospiraceae bacterium]